MDSTCLPYHAFVQIDAEDVEVIEYATNQDDWDCRYRQLTAGTYRGQASAAMLNETLVFEEQHNQSVFVGGAAPVDDYVFGVSLGSPPRRWQGKTPGALDLFILRPGATFDYVFESNTTLAYIQLPRERMNTISMAAGIDVGMLDQDTLRAEPSTMIQLEHLLHLAFEPLSQSEPALLRAQSMTTEQRLLGAIIDALSTVDSSKPSPDRLSSPNATSALARRVRDCMEASLEEPLKLLSLCEQLQCKQRTLYNVFTRYFGEPPNAYHMKIRMNAARSDLLQADHDATTVTDVATRYGFWHLGRFAINYKHLFGESPSQTLATTKPPFTYSSVRHSGDVVSHPQFGG